MRPNCKPKPGSTGLAALLACVAAVAVPATAHAATEISGGNLTRDKSISEWTEHSTKAGTFGVGYAVGYEMESVAGTSQYQRAYANFEAEMFSVRDIVAGGEAYAGTGVDPRLNVTLLGETIRSATTTEPTWSISVNADVDYLEAESIVVVVVVPVTLTAKLSGTNGVEVTFAASTDYNSLNQDITVKPSIGTALSVEAAIGNDDFSGGIGGSLDLIQVAFPITLQFNYNPTTNKLVFGVSGTATLVTLSGSFYLFANAYFVQYKQTLFDWDGIVLDETPVFSDSRPTAGTVILDASDGYRVKAQYQYSDNAGLAESGTRIDWEISDGPNGVCRGGPNCANGELTNHGSTYDLSTYMPETSGYIQACVTPKNAVGNTGEKTCSDWKWMGRVVQFHEHSYFDGQEVAFAYQLTPPGTCFNVPSNFNDEMTSYAIQGPQYYNSMLVMYKDANCLGAKITTPVIDAWGDHDDSSVYNEGFSDVMSSFKIVYEYDVGAAEIDIDFIGDEARAEYDFGSVANFTESGSSKVWERASDANGSNLATVGTGSSTYVVTANDASKYLRFCVTPSDGFFTGDENCSDWFAVGPVALFYKDASYGGSSAAFAYQGDATGTCTNLSTFWMNDELTSLKFTAKPGSNATIAIFKDGNCSGSAAYITANNGGTVSIASLSSAYGSSWNDSVTSFRIWH